VLLLLDVSYNLALLVVKGLPAIYPFLSRRIVQLTKEEFVDLLKSQPVPINSFNRNTKQALSKLGEC